MRYHIHDFNFKSEITNFHAHIIAGYTNKMIGFGKIHFHIFIGVSSYNNHTHYFSGMTGLPIKTDKGHIHKMEGILELNNLHEHPFSNYSFEETNYIARRKFRNAII